MRPAGNKNSIFGLTFKKLNQLACIDLTKQSKPKLTLNNGKKKNVFFLQTQLRTK